MMCFENADEITDDLTKIAWTKIIVHLSLWLQQIIGLLTHDKSKCFAHPCPIVVKYLLPINVLTGKNSKNVTDL